ncbi:SDR family oxidoreductase [Pseudomonadota bacterium]|nr:SDR family oxidoreductase [Pseudomonadota bacterium]
MKNKVVLVIGSTGNIGKLVVSQLGSQNCKVIAMVRDKSLASFGPEVNVVEGDLESNFESLLHNVDCVVFTAGSGATTGFDKTLLVDLWGACKAIDASKKSGVKHFIMISSIGADDPDNGLESIKPYLVAKHFADDYLIASGLPYSILRPGRLTNDEGLGLITTIRPSEQSQQAVSRQDTAKAIIHCVNDKQTHGKIFELYKGKFKLEEVLT